jgi:hypothetical protein
MIKVDFGGWLIPGGGFDWKHLTVDGPIFRFQHWRTDVWLELAWNNRAVLPPDHEGRSELHQQSLFQFIAQAIAVGIALGRNRVRGLLR